MKIDDAIKGRRSIRVFSNKKISWNLIKQIVEAGTWAPSACNLQRWEFIAITKYDLKKEIFKNAGVQKHIINAPVSIIALYDIRFTSKNSANVQSLSAAIQNMLLKSYEIGLGSLWMATIKKPRELQRIIKASKNLFPFAIISFGYSQQKPKPPIRRSVDEVLHKNFFRGDLIPTKINPEVWSEDELEEFQKRYIRARSAKSWNSLNDQERSLLEYFKKGFKTGKTLDLFSCPGFHLKYLDEVSEELFFCERSKEVVSFIKNEIFDGEIKGFVIRDNNLPFKDNSFDTVFCFQKIEQIPDNLKILKEVKRVLRDDGTFYFVVKNKLSYIRLYRLLKRDKVELIHRYFGPFNLINPRGIRKYTKNIFNDYNFIAGVGIIPKSINVNEGICKYFSKFNLFSAKK